MYASMANYLAEKLNVRPAEILDTWSVPELIVTYGQFANGDSQRNLAEWKELDAKQRIKYPRPDEYIVYFVGVI